MWVEVHSRNFGSQRPNLPRRCVRTTLFGRRSAFSLVQKHPKSKKIRLRRQNRTIEKIAKPTHLRTYRSSTEKALSLRTFLQKNLEKYHFWTFHFFWFFKYYFFEKHFVNIFWKFFRKFWHCFEFFEVFLNIFLFFENVRKFVENCFVDV